MKTEINGETYMDTPETMETLGIRCHKTLAKMVERGELSPPLRNTRTKKNWFLESAVQKANENVYV